MTTTGIARPEANAPESAGGGELAGATLPRALARLVPEARRTSSCVLELVPEGRLVPYGIGVSLRDLANPARAAGRVRQAPAHPPGAGPRPTR